MKRSSGTRRSLAALIGSVAIAAWAFAAPAGAHSNHGHRVHHDHGRNDHRRPHHVRELHPRHVASHIEYRHRYGPRPVLVVPATIPHLERVRYRSHYRGTVWYGPHGHRHAIYDFPVHTATGTVYRPHAYCDGRLYLGAHVRYDGPRVSFSVGF